MSKKSRASQGDLESEEKKAKEETAPAVIKTELMTYSETTSLHGIKYMFHVSHAYDSDEKNYLTLLLY